MKKYGLKYHPSLKSEDLPRLSADIKLRIRKSIEDKLVAAPHKYRLPLRKTLKGYWKLRAGDCRVVYNQHKTVTAHKLLNLLRLTQHLTQSLTITHYVRSGILPVQP